jgi:signal transduction histidine kinase
MSLATVLALACAVLSINLAILHGWLYALRRQDRSNLWAAVLAIGIATLCILNVFLYESQDVTRSDWIQRTMVAGTIPVILGFTRYSLAYLGLQRSSAEQASELIALGSGLLCMIPGVLFTGQPVVHHSEALQVHYIESGMSLLGRVALPVFLGFCVYLAYLYRRHLAPDDPNRLTIYASLSFWAATVAHDSLLGLGLYDGPILMSAGYTAFLIGISSTQIRRMVWSMQAVELSTQQLQKAVDERTQELRRTEVQLAHGEQMATIGALGASLAHEINNPIAYVQANLNQLEDSWPRPEDREEVREMLEECEEGIDRVRTIVASLLSIARQSDGVDEPVDLRRLVDSALPIVEREAAYRAVLETDLQPVPDVSADPRLLGHVIFSLMMRSLQAIPEGPEGRHRIHVSTAVGGKAGDRVVLTIRDSGDCEFFDESLGDPLHADDPSGLGLTVAQQLVSRFRGHLQIVSGADGNEIVLDFPSLESSDYSHAEPEGADLLAAAGEAE